MNPRTMLIRADSSAAIGAGHAMRCLALAETWQAAGGTAVFALAECMPAVRDRLQRAGVQIMEMHCTPGSAADAADTVGLAQSRGMNWVVLDGYRFDDKFQCEIKNAGHKLLVVDDMARCTHYSADIVLNQNIHATEGMYQNRDGKTRLLLGTRFTLLRREFKGAREHVRIFPEVGSKLLIMMGGSDPQNMTSRVLEALQKLQSPVQVTVVLARDNPHSEQLLQISRSMKHEVRLLQDPPSMVDLMLWADLAVSAAGTTCWEMCVSGLPSVLIVVAENQRLGAEELHRRGIASYLGVSNQFSSEKLVKEVDQLLRSKPRREEMSAAGKEVLDGLGPERVLTALQTHELRLRRATPEDSRLLWTWANEAAVRAASFQSNPISWEEHASWFAGKLMQSGSAIYIAEDDWGAPVGQLRVDSKDDREAVISISIAPEKRGLGLASVVIANAARTIFQETPVMRLQASIKPQNRASLRAFEKAGFTDFKHSTEAVHCWLQRGAGH